jgi:hypothetical protein
MVRCDRCGAMRQEGTPGYEDGIQLLDIQLIGRDRSTTKKEVLVDLCGHCLQDLKTFFKSDKEGLEIDL